MAAVGHHVVGNTVIVGNGKTKERVCVCCMAVNKPELSKYYNVSSAEILNISKCLAVESILHSQIALAAALASRA